MPTDLFEHVLRVAETWRDFTVAMDLLRRNGMTDDGLRALVDAKNAHAMALDAATLAAMKLRQGPITERSLARAAKGRRP